MKFMLDFSDLLILHKGPLLKAFIVNLLLGSIITVAFFPFLTTWGALWGKESCLFIGFSSSVEDQVRMFAESINDHFDNENSAFLILPGK